MSGTASCYITLGAPCFESFELTSTIKRDLPGGKFYNLLKPMGWVSMGLFVFSWFLLLQFQGFASRRVEAFIAEGKELPDDVDVVGSEDDGSAEEEEEGGEGGGGAKSSAKVKPVDAANS